MAHKISTPRLSEYRLMYLFGAWITHEVICAESDAEAIFDADASFTQSRLQNWKHGVALFKGNKRVKTYVPVV